MLISRPDMQADMTQIPNIIAMLVSIDSDLIDLKSDLGTAIAELQKNSETDNYQAHLERLEALAKQFKWFNEVCATMCLSFAKQTGAKPMTIEQAEMMEQVESGGQAERTWKDVQIAESIDPVEELYRNAEALTTLANGMEEESGGVGHIIALIAKDIRTIGDVLEARGL